MTKSILLSATALLAIGVVAGCSKPAADSKVENSAAATSTTITAPVTPASIKSTPGGDQSGKYNVPSPAAFASAVAISDMYEISAAKIAEARSSTPAVKKFAEMMVTDHSKTSAQLKAIVAKAPEIGALPTALDTAHQALIADLKSVDSTKFDKVYLDQQVTAHQNAESLLSSYASQGSNADLKVFASDVVPKVAGHLHMVQMMVGDASQSPAKPAG